MKLDFTALDDWRIRRLATLTGDAYETALLLCLRVWRRLYERGGGVMSRAEVDASAGREGMSDMMVECGLAEVTADGVRVRGDDRAAATASFRASQSRKGLSRQNSKAADKEPAGAEPRLSPGLATAKPSISNMCLSLSLSSSGSGSGSPDPDARVVAEYLLAAIRSHKPDMRDGSAGWTRDIGLALRLDGRTPDRLRAVIDYAHRSREVFWRANLLSGKALRKHCERIEIQAQSAPSRDVRVGHVAVTGAEKYAGGEVKL